MSSLAASGWLLGKNKAADQEKGVSCLIGSVDLKPLGVQHFLTGGFRASWTWPFIDLITAVND